MPTHLARAQSDIPWPTLAAASDPAADIADFLPVELAARRTWLRERRWEKPGIHRWLWLIVLVIILVHLAWLVVLRSASHPHAPPKRPDSAIHIRLIDEVLPAPVAAPREMEPMVVTAPTVGKAVNSPAPPRAEAPARPVEAPAPQSGTSESVVATPAVRLYNPDGSLRLRLAPNAPKDPMAKQFAAAAELQARGHNVVRCRSTRFAGAWKPDESVGDEVARKYLGFIGLYNPHSAAKTGERAADASAACDGDGF